MQFIKTYILLLYGVKAKLKSSATAINLFKSDKIGCTHQRLLVKQGEQLLLSNILPRISTPQSQLGLSVTAL